ncbi:hypothetical protein OG470_32470 [Micromonospora sp. NBC_00389]|uniref:hypothetical protein n=1 Tax=Micromonospora sp. NBC_00389 TaxID=2903586 RepID=UPI002E24D509
MANWIRLGTPGEVVWARASSEATAIVVGTAGGQLYLRRRTGPAWRWERVGTPPTTDEVRDATLLTVEASGTLTLAVVGGDTQVWLYRSEATSGSWVDLGGPTRDSDLDFVDAGKIVNSTTRRDTTTRHTLVVTSPSQRPWIRVGVDPDGTWFPIMSDPDLFVGPLASAIASVAPAAEPQQHIFALVRHGDSPDFALRVAVRENSVWKWIDPGGPQPSFGFFTFGPGLSATSIRDSSGRLEACAIVETGFPETTIGMVIGSGHDWRWCDLGRPSVAQEVGAAVVAGKGPDPQPDEEPVVVCRAGHNIWTRSLNGTWTDRGTTPDDVAVVSPTAAFEVDATAPQRRLWTAGVSWSSDLWTFESDDAGTSWQKHPGPGSVTDVVGAFTDAPDDASAQPPSVVFVVDEHGDLWGCRLWVGEGGAQPWNHHGRPAAAVTSKAGVGVFAVAGASPPATWVFVVGSDGHLWAWTVDAAGSSWVDHGAPTPGTSIECGVAPIAVGAAEVPTVHVLADDGRIWMRSRSGPEWCWTDVGAPQGRQIFGFVGAEVLAAAAGQLPVAVVVTDNGHLWISLPDGASFRWRDLGTPTPTEKISAGIGVGVVTPATVDIVAVGLSRQVWTVRWTPDGEPHWTARGCPADAPIQQIIGTMRDDPGNPAGCLVAVIVHDKEVWVTSTASPDGEWSHWDGDPPFTKVLCGKAVVLGTMPCGVLLDESRRVHVVTRAFG